MNLEQRQRLFADSIIVHRSPSTDIVPGGTLTAETALGVYKAAYPARLTEQLHETYEGIESVVGHERFHELCAEFIAAHPSTSYNMSDYGREFQAFLCDKPEHAAYPYLEELAGFEWAFKDLFHQKEHPHLPSAEFAKAGQETRFVWGDAVRLFKHVYPVAQIWNLRKEPAAPFGGDMKGPELMAAFKKDGEIFFRFFEKAEYALLEKLRLGESVGGAIAATPGLDGEMVGTLFAFLAESGIVEKLR